MRRGNESPQFTGKTLAGFFEVLWNSVARELFLKQLHLFGDCNGISLFFSLKIRLNLHLNHKKYTDWKKIYWLPWKLEWQFTCLSTTDMFQYSLILQNWNFKGNLFKPFPATQKCRHKKKREKIAASTAELKTSKLLLIWKYGKKYLFFIVKF